MTPKTIAVLSATVERAAEMSGRSTFTALYKVERQTVGRDEDARTSAVLFGYNSDGYAFLETLPYENPTEEAQNRIADYTLDAELIGVEVNVRNEWSEIRTTIEQEA